MRRQIPHCLMGIFFCLVFVGLIRGSYADTVAKYTINNSEEKNWDGLSNLVGSDETESLQNNDLSVTIFDNPNGNIYGAYSNDSMSHESDNNISQNTVNISDSTVNTALAIYGGYLENISGTGYSNKVNITNSNFTAEGIITIKSSFIAKGKSQGNEVNINNSRFKTTPYNGIHIHGAESAFGGICESNTLNISESTLDSADIRLYGGFSGTLAEKNSSNTVNITNKSKISGGMLDIAGGFIYNDPNSSGHKVNISDCDITSNYININGAATFKGNLENNKITIENSNFTDYTICEINGGINRNEKRSIKEDATFNEILITNSNFSTSSLDDNCFINGSCIRDMNSESDNAICNSSYNKISIINSHLNNNCTINGGFYNKQSWSCSKSICNANYNKIDINKSSINGQIFGGYTSDGETQSNEVSITDSEITGKIYGGNQEKTSNNFYVNGETNSAFNIYNFETINFNIATATTDKALLTITDDANKVDLSDVTINITDIPIKDNNSITLIKTQNGIDYSNNIFKINDIECTDGSLSITEADKANKWIKHSFYQYDKTAVPNNLVLKYDTIFAAAYTDNTGKKTSTTFNYLIMSDEISEMKHIYGSFSEKGDATGATVKINKTIDLSNTNLIGGYSADGGNVHDNILEVSASDVKIKSIDKFDNYVFTLDSEKHGKNIISTADSVDMTGVSIKVHLLAGSLAKNQQITLMDKVNNVDLTKLSINGINSQSVKNAFNQKSEYLIIGETAFTTEDNKLGLVGKDAFITAAFVNSKGKILEKSNRTITLSDKVTDYDRIFGTYSEKGDATGATVKIDTTLDLSNTSLIGGYSEDGGKVSDNTLEVSASDLNINSIENFDNYVFTLNSEKYGKNIISTADKVDLKDASINVSLSDGSLAKNQQIILLDKVNNVDVNKLSINGINGQSLKFASAEEDSEYVTVGETAFITENNKLGLVGKEAFLTASYADKNGEILEKSDKTIILSDTATAYDTIYGMYSDNGSAIGATIKINTSLDLSNTNLIGGYAPKGFEVAGCTLDISAKDITVNSVSAFDKIGFTLNSDIISSDTVLKTKEAVNLKDITIDVKLDPADDNFVINKGEKILLADNVTGKDTAIFNINGEARDSISNVATHDEYVRVRSFGYDKTDSSNLAIIGIDDFAAGCFIDADNKSYETKSGKVITLGKSSSANIKANVRASDSGLDFDFSKMSDIYGIYSDGSADATGAEVNIDSAINYNDTILHGGYSRLGKVYGNTLNVRAANSRVKGITDFENLNFVLGADIKNGDTMLKVAEKVDLEPTNNIGVDGTSATGLHAGDSVNLLVCASGIEGFGTQEVKLEGLTDKNGVVELSDSNTLKLNLKKENQNANTKAPAEGIAAAAILVNEASDLTAGALNRSMLEMDSNDMNTFAAIGGGHTKTETGSYVKNNSWNLGFGIGKKGLSTKNPNTTYGMFFQYGKSNFDTHNGSFRGDGDAKNLGFGLMYHSDGKNNYYYDGAAYIGKLDAKWSCVAGGYDESATYRGITLGMGHRNYVKDNRVVDTYGKYFFNHTNAMSGVIDGHSYSFDSVDSSRLRLGLRIEQIKNTSARPYFGFAWEHEFSGDARSTMDLGRVDAPSLKGDTGIVEVGYKWKRGNWDINVNAEGSFGKREGVTGAASFYYNF